MFKKLLILLACATLPAAGQKRVILDHSNESKHQIPTCMNEREFITVEVLNLNRARYTVEIKAKSIEFQTEIPENLKKLFMIKETEEEKGKEKAEAAAQAMISIEKDLASVLSRSPDKNNVQLKSEVGDLIRACQDYLTAANKVFDAIRLRNELIMLSKSPGVSFVELQRRLVEAQSKEKLEKAIADYNEFERLYAEAYIKYEGAENYASDKDVKEKTKTASEKLEEGHEILKKEYREALTDATGLYAQLKDAGNFIVVSNPFQVDGDADQIELTVTIKEKESGEEVSYPIIIPITSGLKTTFSVGPVLSLGKGSKNEKYYLTEPGSDSKVGLRALQNRHAINPTLAGMMHFYKRNCKKIAFGGAFGLGAGFETISDIDLSFLLGGSMILGKEKLVILSLGVSFLKVDRLKKDQFNTTTQYEKSVVNLDSVTEKVFRPSLGFAISYNMARRQ